MKISYVAFNYEKYTLGYYYEDWVDFFSLNHTIFRIDPSNTSLDTSFSCLNHSDLIIIGHSIFDKFNNFSTPFKNIKNFILAKKIKKISSNVPVIYFSKNDYKVDNLKWKYKFSQIFGSKLFITHTLYALPYFKHFGKAIHVPFFANPNRFYRKDNKRSIDIGYRGTLHEKWNFSRRTEMIEKIRTYKKISLDILPSSGLGINFLNGSEYNEWMNKCSFNINTVSALGTVGPKFYEQFLTGVVPLSPIDWYEGLMLPYVNYIPSNDITETKLIDYLSDRSLISKIRYNNSKLISINSIQQCVKDIVKAVV